MQIICKRLEKNCNNNTRNQFQACRDIVVIKKIKTGAEEASNWTKIQKRFQRFDGRMEQGTLDGAD